MRGSLRSKVVCLGLVAGSALLAAPAANAAIAGGTPAGFVDRPNLVSSAVIVDNIIGTKRVEYCFDRALRNTPIDDNGFAVTGYRAIDYNVSTDAVLNLDKTNCVIATFPLVIDVANATVGVVDAGAVRDVAGSKINQADATPLTTSKQGVGAGDTPGPNIKSVTADPSFNDLVVKYDRAVLPIAAGAFHYYDQAGNFFTSNGVTVDVGDATIVRVSFPTFGGTISVRDAVRFTQGTGLNGITFAPAVVDATTHVGEIQSFQAITQSTGTTNGETARPDLIAARISGPTSVDYTFDEPVEVDNVGRFGIIDPSLVVITGDSSTVLNSNQRTVRVWFGVDSSDAIANGQINAGVVAGAVESNDSASLDNSVGTLAIGALPHSTGYTSAPDLVKVEFNKEDGTALLTFDQDVDDTNGTALFFLYDRFGNRLGGTGNPSDILEIEGNTVKLLFGEDRVENAVAVGLDYGAVEGTGTIPALSIEQIVAVSPPAATSPADGGTPPAVVSPGSSTSVKGATSLKLASVKIKKIGSKRVLKVRVNGSAKTVKLKIRVTSSKGKLVRVVRRTIKTNKIVTVSNVVLKQGQKVKITVA